MEDKPVPATTCQWITTDDVTEQKFEGETLEDFYDPENIRKIFEYRCNKLVQKVAMSIARETMMKKKTKF